MSHPEFSWQHPTAWRLWGNKGGREGGSGLNTSVSSLSLLPYPADVSKRGHAPVGTASNYPHLHTVPMLDRTSSNHEPNKPFLSSCFIWSQKWTKSWISNNKKYIWMFNKLFCTIYFILYFLYHFWHRVSGSPDWLWVLHVVTAFNFWFSGHHPLRVLSWQVYAVLRGDPKASCMLHRKVLYQLSHISNPELHLYIFSQ